MSSDQCHGHGLIGDDGEIAMESLFLQFRSNRAQYTISYRPMIRGLIDHLFSIVLGRASSLHCRRRGFEGSHDQLQSSKWTDHSRLDLKLNCGPSIRHALPSALDSSYDTVY